MLTEDVNSRTNNYNELCPMLEEADLDHEVSNVVSGISDVAITRGPAQRCSLCGTVCNPWRMMTTVREMNTNNLSYCNHNKCYL